MEKSEAKSPATNYLITDVSTLKGQSHNKLVSYGYGALV
jgi:hypothetical protein